MKILIAEDDPVSATLLRTLLTQWDYDVVITENGDEALSALAASDGPSLAILDSASPTIFGSLGGWMGARVGLMTGFFASMVGTAFGFYVARRFVRDYLE